MPGHCQEGQLQRSVFSSEHQSQWSSGQEHSEVMCQSHNNSIPLQLGTAVGSRRVALQNSRNASDPNPRLLAAFVAATTGLRQLHLLTTVREFVNLTSYRTESA